MISTSYNVIRTVEDNGVATITLQVNVVDEVIGNFEGHKNTESHKVVVHLDVGYTVTELQNAITLEGFNL